jgi:signal transduction histidine kinase
MLEGFEKEWNTSSSIHAATYTNLDPGEYIFKVKGMNGEGEWSSKDIELRITIIPPFWKTLWFRIMLALLSAMMITFVFILRTRTIRRSNRELAEAVTEKTKEINAKNKILFHQREELAAQNEELLQSQEEITAQRDIVAKQNETLESEVEKRTRELVDYNHQLEQFAFISAHNLRAPVARILGLGHLLELEATKNERDEIYPKLVSATRELDGVVKDLNTILYLKKNSDSLITDVDLQEEVSMIIDNLEHEISITNTKITTNFSDVQNIRTVKPYLDSIIYNLVSNAIKYRHRERDPLIYIQTEKIHKEVCLSFTDNGLGIDTTLFHDKLFTLYSRFHSHVEGKGMGLYLVKTQLDAMGGRVEIESKVNIGTTFKVYFKQ